MKITQSFGGLLVVAALAVPSYGAIVNAPHSGPGEQNLYDILGMANSTVPNTAQIVTDETWNTAIGNQYSTLMIEQAGNLNNNEFGIYEIGNTANKLTIFPGPDNGDLSAPKYVTFSGTTITLGASSINVAGGNFGFYLARGGAYPTFYSQTTLNGGDDQMVTYNILSTQFGYAPYNLGNTGWVFAWEDVEYGAGDKDFNDMIVSLTAQPIPEPTTVIAGALLLLPFAASMLRVVRRKHTA